ncbi:hypothetical protein [Catellatospora citrea]|uniref:Uncharacterized protein n=1 Tax=Catellatospora citrea TaxID=53366 RepID=A0A8J3K8F7_9ACTN|nr:hypothetical protein [Catellatospora citrea]GIF96044.1 hypothetical protein Cci01nite_11380 [Catellatospora citrea]
MEQYLDDDLPGGDEEPGVLTDTEARFVAALRQHAATWTVPSATTFVCRVDDGQLAAVVRIAGSAWGAHLSGGSMYCGMLHNQLHYPLPERFGRYLTATGHPADLARDTARWLEALLRRPVVEHHWVNRERVYRQRCLFADTGQLLWSGYDHSLAPLSLLFRRRRDPDSPDRVVAVRNWPRAAEHSASGGAHRLQDP